MAKLPLIITIELRVEPMDLFIYVCLMHIYDIYSLQIETTLLNVLPSLLY